MKHHRSLLAVASFAAFMAVSGTASAQYRVVGVAYNDTLNVREEPTINSRILGALAPDARNIDVGDCTFSGWCMVYVGRLRGWVNKNYLARQY